MSSEKPVDLPSAPVAAPPVGSAAHVAPPRKDSEPLATPAQPAPRPLSPNSQNQATLIEAFPNIDAAVVRAVLVASRGDLEPAFNALLSMSDPSAVAEETPPPQPPRPRSTQPTSTSTPQNQLEADALYARQLQEHFGAPAPRQHPSAEAGVRRSNTGGKPSQRRHPNDESDDEYYANDDRDRPSFFEEDLPVIKENIKKGFLETQAKVTGWFDDLRKKIDGEDQPEGAMGRAHGEQSPPLRNSSQYARTGNRRQYGVSSGSYDAPRRSRDGYDADPKVLSDDFTHLGLKDNTSESAPRRPKANPNLFQPSSATGHRVSFEDRPTLIDNTNDDDEDDDDLYRPASATANKSSPAVKSKWQPLRTVDVEPLNKDPFSLEDSDDEKDGLTKESEEKDAKKLASVTGPQETGVMKNP